LSLKALTTTCLFDGVCQILTFCAEQVSNVPVYYKYWRIEDKVLELSIRKHVHTKLELLYKIDRIANTASDDVCNCVTMLYELLQCRDGRLCLSDDSFMHQLMTVPQFYFLFFIYLFLFYNFFLFWVYFECVLILCLHVICTKCTK